MASTNAVQNGDCHMNGPLDNFLPGDCNESGVPQVCPKVRSGSSDASDELREPEITPRIGDAYQVDVTPIIHDSLDIPDLQNHMDLESGSCHNMLIGLPIPLTWMSHVKCDALESRRTSLTIPDFKNFEKSEPCSDGQDVGLSEMKEKIRKRRGQGYVLVPGQYNGRWSDDEKASFLLALYLFGKNFVEVKRFLETKEMGAILSFYYGKFYGSKDYTKWSECRNAKSKKCVYGQRLFSGLRQQELLSRILPTVSAECQSALLEVSKSFSDEKMSLVDYVSSLKAMVGMNILVKVVGIGAGKHDLTRMVLEPPKSNPASSSRLEIPTGKACSSLTTPEIIKFLNGGCRLSKARSNDLFWEAVWPRLLARGWHSEQPKNQGVVFGSKNSLVFLIPGVNKFSRRKLVKGNHYFDSVTDVLSKVANEPGLIELDKLENDGEKNKEPDKCTRERKLKHYLQPRLSNRASRSKFTVVDTSLSGGAVRELRSLPSEISDMLTSREYIGESGDDSSEEIAHESNAYNTNTSLRVTESSGKLRQGMNEHEASASNQDTNGYPGNVGKSVVNLKKKKDSREKKRSKKVKLEKGSVAPVKKRCRKLPVCSHGETGNCTICSRTYRGSDEIYGLTEDASYVNSCQDKLSSTISSKCSPSNSVECTRTMIDLNLPRVFPGYDHDTFTTEPSKEPDARCLPNSPACEVKTEQQTTVNPRRQSTRNRPPTARVLEALANGYLTVGKRRKGKDMAGSHEDVGFRPPHRARFQVNESSNSHASKETENGPSNSGNQSHHTS